MAGRFASIRTAVEDRQLTAFAVLTLALSWGWWGLVAVLGSGSPSRAMLVPGAFGPPVAAAAVVAASDRSLRGWLAARLRWRVAPRWYLAALAVPLLLAGVITAAVVLAGGSLDPSVLGRRLAVFPLLLVVTALVGGGQEELGWRGFALPRLQARYSALTASLLVGGLWAVWHAPLFLVGAPRNGTGSFALYAVLVVAFSVVLGWLYNGAGGSVLPAVVLHAAVNTSGSVVPATMGTLAAFPLVTDAASTAGMVVLALAAVAWGGAEHLSRRGNTERSGPGGGASEGEDQVVDPAG